MEYSLENATTGIQRLVGVEFMHVGDRRVLLVEGVPMVKN